MAPAVLSPTPLPLSLRPSYVKHPHSPCPQVTVQPDFDTVTAFLNQYAQDDPETPNVIPLFASIPAEFLNPSSAYLKLTAS